MRSLLPMLLWGCGLDALAPPSAPETAAPAPPLPTGGADQPEVDAPVLVLNELMPLNHTGPTDEAGQDLDWVELYNAGTDAVSLEGWTLSDGGPRRALDASLSVAPGGTLLLWLDDAAPLDPHHVQLRLSSHGDRLELGHDGTTVDEVAFGPLLPDVALARVGDGAPDWEVVEAGTPGASNGDAAVAADPSDRVCGPTVAVADPHVLEGEVAEVRVACTADDIGAFTVGTLGTATVTDGVLRWPTGYADAGTHALLLWLKPAGHTGVPETALATVWVADAWDEPANVRVDPLAYVEEWGVPVLHLDALGPISEAYTPAVMAYDGVRYDGQFKIRGAVSVGYPKNSFTVEFDPIQVDLHDVGLQNKDHLVLITTFDDNAYVRQKLVFDTWKAMAAWAGQGRLTPRTFFVVVYLDGVYHGLYTGVDHVDDEFLREMGLESGDDLFKSVNHDANFYLTNGAGNPKGSLHDGWEKKEGEPLDDFGTIEALTDFVATASHDAFAQEVDTWIARTEFMDWWALVHWLAADDSGGKNAYLYLDPATARFRFAPWDFNHSVGQTWQTARQGPDSYQDFVGANGIFWHFLSEPGLAAEHTERFAGQRRPGHPLDPGVLHDRLDSYYAAIDDSAARDWAKWEALYRSYGGWNWRDDFTSYDEEKAYVYQWVLDRDAWMTTYHGAP